MKISQVCIINQIISLTQVQTNLLAFLPSFSSLFLWVFIEHLYISDIFVGAGDTQKIICNHEAYILVNSICNLSIDVQQYYPKFSALNEHAKLTDPAAQDWAGSSAALEAKDRPGQRSPLRFKQGKTCFLTPVIAGSTQFPGGCWTGGLISLLTVGQRLPSVSRHVTLCLGSWQHGSLIFQSQQGRESLLTRGDYNLMWHNHIHVIIYIQNLCNILSVMSKSHVTPTLKK